jgi:hypothetical protein
VIDKGIKKGVQIYQGKTNADVAKDAADAADAEAYNNINKKYEEETGMSIADKINQAFN